MRAYIANVGRLKMLSEAERMGIGMQKKTAARKQASVQGTHFGRGLLLSVLTALFTTAGLIVFEALVLKATPLSDKVMTAMNYVIRFAALFAGSVVFGKKAADYRGWQRAGSLGVLYWLCMALLHRATAKTTAPLPVLLTDVALCIAMALVCGAFSGAKRGAHGAHGM